MIQLPKAIVADRRGSIAVEFALILPVAAMLFLGIFNYGIGMLFDLRLTFAVEAAARAYASGIVTTDADAASYAKTGAGLPGDDAGQDYAAGTADCGKWVSGVWRLELITLFPAVNLQARACYPSGS